VREAVLVDLLDEVAEHLLRDVEVGDDTVLERADRRDRPGRAAEHALRLDSDRMHFPGSLVDGDDRRLREDDPAPPHVDERVCSAQVHGHVAAAEAVEVPQEAHCPAPECSDSVENCEGVPKRHVPVPGTGTCL
jgi:hypothetical protein